MKKFDNSKFMGKRKTGKFGDRPSFGGRSRSGGRGRDSFSDDRGSRFKRSGPAELFEAVCAECGNTCEVPFKPTGSKPVYCRNCFKKQQYSEGGSSTVSHAPTRNDSLNTSAQLDEINHKLDQILRALRSNNEE